jgi:hypothetical protein
MLLRKLLALFLLTASSAVLADTIDFNLRDNSVQLQYIAPMGRDTLGSSEVHAGFLYTSDQDRYGDIGLLVQGEVGDGGSGVIAGVGLKGIVARVDVNDVGAIALGGQVRFGVPSVSRLSIIGQLYFSPNIVTYRDAERVIEAGARVEYELIPQASAYLGYRRIAFNLISKSDIVLDTGFHAGVRMSF